MLKQTIIILIAVSTLTACNRAKDAAKEVINQTGETVGKGSTEFARGVAEGVDQTLQCNVQIGKKLQEEGLDHGKFRVDFHGNVLTSYLIFNKEFKNDIVVKVFDEKGEEYGRTRKAIQGKKGDAGYFTFDFDSLVRIETKSRFVMEAI
jgi:hypothetical protein